MINNKKILITGCYGFLAQHLTHHLISNNNIVYGIYNKKYQKLIFDFNYSIKKNKLKIFKIDIQDNIKVKNFLSKNKFDYCFHLAAISQVLDSNINPRKTFDTNFMGTLNLLENFRVINNNIKFIFSSTDKVYGDSNKLPYNEQSLLNGINPYDASKVCADILARSYALSFKMNISVTRSVNIYGPGDVNWDRIFPGTIKTLIFNKKPIIRSNGKFLRDYIYIDDVVDGYIRIARYMNTKYFKTGLAFNFGHNNPVSVIDIVKKILVKFNKNEKYFQVLNKSKNEIKDQYSDYKNAKKYLNWYPKTSLNEGLEKSIIWYKKNLRK